MVVQAARLVFTLLYFAYGNVAAAPPNDIGTKTVTLKKIAQCTSGRKLNVLIEDVIITSRKNLQSVSAKINVKEDIKNQFYMQLNIRKCDVNGNPDHCEYVIRNYNSTNICGIMNLRDEAWSYIFDHLDGPKECPIKKGIYTMENVTITNDVLALVPFGSTIWKVHLTGFDSGLNILCVELEVVVKIVHARNNRGRRQ